MKNRQTVRKFSETPISEEIIVKIVEASVSAPSGAGMEGTNITIVDDPDLKQQLRIVCEAFEREWVESQPEVVRERIREIAGFSFEKSYFEKAPVIFVVTTRPRDPEVPYAVESAYLAVGYMLVIIESLGLGCVTYTPSVVKPENYCKIADIIGLPEGEEIQVMLPVGYPETRPDPKPPRPYYNVFRNRYGEIFKPGRK